MNVPDNIKLLASNLPVSSNSWAWQPNKASTIVRNWLNMLNGSVLQRRAKRGCGAWEVATQFIRQVDLQMRLHCSACASTADHDNEDPRLQKHQSHANPIHK